jgi:uncharacterized protein YqeY
MDINKLITEVNAEYMPLKLKSKTAGANLTDAEAETLFELSTKLELFKILKTSFMEEITKNAKVMKYFLDNKLVTMHKEIATDANNKTVEVDVPDQSMEERISMLPDIFAHPILEKMVKGHKENIDLLAESDPRLKKEKYELEILNGFLPKEATDTDIYAYLDEHYPSGVDQKMMGKVIGEVKAAFKRADGRLISECVKKRIS